MKVFLDTNVLVSAFATRGLCADVLRVVLAEHELVLSRVVLKELRRVLTQKLKMPGDIVLQILELLEAHLGPARPVTLPKLDIQDQDDLQVLISAIGAQADVLITGDEDLLQLKDEVPHLSVTSPRGFWDQVQKGLQ